MVISVLFFFSFSPVPFSRAYINFKNPKDILNFKEKLDGYVFTDMKGKILKFVCNLATYLHDWWSRKRHKF